MKNYYGDILSRIDAEPLWWDEYGVPRFDEFTPNDAANIYADETVLMQIDCQSCGTSFNVAMSARGPVRDIDATWLHQPLRDAVLGSYLHYGDPPNNDCCVAGPTMNSVPRRILEFWGRDGRDDVRMPELEVEFDEETTYEARSERRRQAMAKYEADKAARDATS